MRSFRSRRKVWLAPLLGLTVLAGGCGSSEEAPDAAQEERAERPSNDHDAPPLGKPRPKKLPGDQLEDEDENESDY